MKNKTIPNPDKIFPVPNCDTVTYVKPIIKNPNIIVRDFTYFSDVDFESHVTHHYEFYGDRLIIGKFCQIASGVNFVMNSANHQMNAVLTYPFYIMEGWEQDVPPLSEMPMKNDTVIGSDVPPYTIVAGNPALEIRKHFDDELINLMLEFRWWDRSIDEINSLIPLLSCSDLKKVKFEIKSYMKRSKT